jgi:GxxExxY protein
MGGKYIIRNKNLLHPELSFTVNGVLFNVFKQLGGGHEAKIKYKEQYYVPLTFNNKTVGKYFLDFLIEDKIILELKRGRYLPINILNQTKGYLSALNLELALIGCFAQDTVVIKRIINIK